MGADFFSRNLTIALEAEATILSQQSCRMLLFFNLKMCVFLICLTAVLLKKGVCKLPFGYVGSYVSTDLQDNSGVLFLVFMHFFSSVDL